MTQNATHLKSYMLNNLPVNTWWNFSTLKSWGRSFKSTVIPLYLSTVHKLCKCSVSLLNFLQLYWSVEAGILFVHFCSFTNGEFGTNELCEVVLIMCPMEDRFLWKKEDKVICSSRNDAGFVWTGRCQTITLLDFNEKCFWHFRQYCLLTVKHVTAFLIPLYLLKGHDIWKKDIFVNIEDRLRLNCRSSIS